MKKLRPGSKRAKFWANRILNNYAGTRPSRPSNNAAVRAREKAYRLEDRQKIWDADDLAFHDVIQVYRKLSLYKCSGSPGLKDLFDRGKALARLRRQQMEGVDGR